VRRVRTMLDAMPEVPLTLSTEALNLQTKSNRLADLERIGDFRIEAELAEGRLWIVHGAALERFAQMTDWSFFEAALRFQRVLKACGLWAELERQGVQVGDTVVIGDVEFAWSASQTEGEMYEAWLDESRAQGRVGKGSARWPHRSG
jgi:Obg family GTPase CgtA-like protein